jgi:hypothetical protein
MLSKSRKKLSRGISRSLDLRMHHNINQEKETPVHKTKDIKDVQPQDNQSNPNTKMGDGKMNKDTGKWCKFHKISWHNTDECRSKKSLVAALKALESDLGSDSDYEQDLGSNSD